MPRVFKSATRDAGLWTETVQLRLDNDGTFRLDNELAGGEGGTSHHVHGRWMQNRELISFVVDGSTWPHVPSGTSFTTTFAKDGSLSFSGVVLRPKRTPGKKR